MSEPDADVLNDPSTKDPNDWITKVPVAGDLYLTGRDIGTAVTEDHQALIAVGGDVAGLGLNAVIYFADPLNFVISAGLTFLVNVVQPMHDALDWVTGNPAKMGAEVEKWGRVGAALGPLAQEIRTAADHGLVGWTGDAADAAKRRLHEFADGVASLQGDVANLTMLMDIFKALMETAEQLVVGLISTFVEWLVWTWLAAIPLAPVTFGGSTAAAGAATAGEAASTWTKIVRFTDKVGEVIKSLRRILYRISNRATHRGQSLFQPRNAIGRFTRGWSPPVGALMKDWRTWAPGTTKGASKILTDLASGLNDASPSMSSVDQDAALGGA
jgi:hypothetical protein